MLTPVIRGRVQTVTLLGVPQVHLKCFKALRGPRSDRQRGPSGWGTVFSSRATLSALFAVAGESDCKDLSVQGGGLPVHDLLCELEPVAKLIEQREDGLHAEGEEAGVPALLVTAMLWGCGSIPWDTAALSSDLMLSGTRLPASHQTRIGKAEGTAG